MPLLEVHEVAYRKWHVLFLNLLAKYLELEEVEVALQYLRVTDWVKVLR